MSNEEAGVATTTVAVIGATGTAGSRVTARLHGRHVAVVEIARARGVDLITGQGLSEALRGVDVVIDVSNPMPTDEHADIVDAVSTACQNLMSVCAARGIKRLVVSTITGIEDPAFDEFAYFRAKRSAQEVVLTGSVPATLVKSTQWYEFATSSAAVNFDDGEVVAQDWLIQPVAVGTVADVLVEAALGQTRTPRTVTGPEIIRLPDLVSKLLAWQGDSRCVRAAEPASAALARGALLAPNHAIALGPDVETWLATYALNGAGRAPICGTDNLRGPRSE